ncbi:MAG: Pyrroline-5-carboxylate reductase [Chlamydiales bacterium]|nr:Pyrroline-5-carboxylate reductase [Chlamydiales bacterium]
MRIRIIGCGAMGSALAHILAISGKEVTVHDQHEERAQALATTLPVRVATTPLQDQTSDELLLLAIKPQDFHTILPALAPFHGQLVVSILTGISTTQLKQAFPHHSVLRMMPNLAIRYGDGITALAEDPTLEPLKKLIDETFAPLGMIRWIPEDQFDAVTALTGSGPAFVFALVEAMIKAATELGFTPEEGDELVKQMVGGSLTLLYESNVQPGELVKRICSPGGTTIAGIQVLEQKGVQKTLVDTFMAAYHRSQEMGKSP